MPLVESLLQSTTVKTRYACASSDTWAIITFLFSFTIDFFSRIFKLSVMGFGVSAKQIIVMMCAMLLLLFMLSAGDCSPIAPSRFSDTLNQTFNVSLNKPFEPVPGNGSFSSRDVLSPLVDPSTVACHKDPASGSWACDDTFPTKDIIKYWMQPENGGKVSPGLSPFFWSGFGVSTVRGIAAGRQWLRNSKPPKPYYSYFNAMNSEWWIFSKHSYARLTNSQAPYARRLHC